MENVTSTTYPNLRTWRMAQDSGKGWTQQQAADFLGISQPGYRAIELGHTQPRAGLAAVIVELTGVPLRSLSGVA